MNPRPRRRKDRPRRRRLPHCRPPRWPAHPKRLLRIALERSWNQEVSTGVASGTAPLAERIRRRLALALQKATHPEPSPAQQAAEAREELLRLRQALSQSDQKVDKLLPPLFRERSVKVSSSLGSEMKDAIEVDRQRVERLENQARNTCGARSPSGTVA